MISLVAARPGLRAWRRLHGIVRDVVAGFVRDQGFLLASALSFSLLLCLAPLALILFSVAGFLLESDEIAEYLFDGVWVLFPAYGAELAEFLAILMRERTITGILGAGGMIVFATQLFAFIRSVVNRAFDVRVERGWLRGFLFDVTSVLVLGSMVVAFVVAIVVLAALGDLALQLVPLWWRAGAPLRRALTLPLIWAVGLALLFLVYRTFPNTWVSTRAAAVATGVVAVLWEAARWGFSAYLDIFGVYPRLYGSFGIGVATLVWIFVSAVIFVAGAELAAVLTARARLAGRHRA